MKFQRSFVILIITRLFPLHIATDSLITTTSAPEDDVSEQTTQSPKPMWKTPWKILSPDKLSVEGKKLGHFISNQLTNNAKEEHITKLGIMDISVLGDVLSGTRENGKTEGICVACQVLMWAIVEHARNANNSESSMIKFVTTICTTFHIATEEVCSGGAKRIIPPFYWIIKQRKKITPSLICGFLAQSFGCTIPPGEYSKSVFNWRLNLEKEKRDLDAIHESKVKTFEKIWAGKDNRKLKQLKILQLTDPHLQFDYLAGTNAKCSNKYLCCRLKDGWPEGGNSSKEAAGFYGDARNCDPPERVLRMALKHIKEEHGESIDLIYMTGDLVPHNVWETTIKSNQNVIRRVSKIFLEYWKDAIVIPCLGNHEAHPINFFSPTYSGVNPIPKHLRSDWIYSTAYDVWKQWIPHNQRETFLRGGNFAVDISHNFRVLVVNTNIGGNGNVWQFYSPVDLGGQLSWLVKQLEYSRRRNASVHILGHIPPGHSDMFKTWGREFYKIINEYGDIIKAQFYGHEHTDEFTVYHRNKLDPLQLHKKKSQSEEPFNIAWISPSLTPIIVNNAAYRIYSVDLDPSDHNFGLVSDHETWIYDLQKENTEYSQNHKEVEQVSWFKFYQATEAYGGITNLFPSSLQKVVEEMSSNSTKFDLFYKFYYKIHSPENSTPGCDKSCKMRVLCNLVQNYYDGGADPNCDRIKMQLENSNEGPLTPLQKGWNGMKKLVRM